MIYRILIAAAAALAAFCAVVFLCIAAVPLLLGILAGCVPPTGSCGDGVGWAVLISAPITLPLTLILAVGAAAAAYVTVARRLKG